MALLQMIPVDDRIVKFIKRHHVMTLATYGEDGEPYCSNLFYSYIPEENLFVFTSDACTRHFAEMKANPFVAASIVLETRMVGNIQGLQLQGRVAPAGEGELVSARKSYLKRFPYAAVAGLTLWTMKPTFMKLTDNRLGFGKKLIWKNDGR